MTRWLMAAASLLWIVTGGVDGSEYEVGPGDKLRIEVGGRPEMTDTFEINAEGMITYWEVGRVKASGYTPQSLAAKLTTLLVEGRFMRRPQVRVSVAEYGSQRVYVAGAVARQGYYALKADRLLRGFMSEVPFVPQAGHEVIVIRPGLGETSPPPAPTTPPVVEGSGTEPSDVSDDSEEPSGTSDEDAPSEPEPPAPIEIPGLPPIDPSNEVLRVNMLELQVGGSGKDVVLRSGDTVYVPRAAQVYVTGAVARPGIFRFEPGMTVLQALTLAGGISPRGSEGRTKVIRIENGEKVERKVRPTDALLPEDRLEVPERFF